METIIFENSARLADAASDEIIRVIEKKPDALICMASGHSPKMTCELFTEKVKQRNLSATDFYFVGLDEWVGVPPEISGSCHSDFNERLFIPLDMKPDRYHLFNGMSSDLQHECKKMDEYIFQRGGIDLMIVGIGMNGHIGFNEPGCKVDAFAHVAQLEEITSSVGQKYFKSSMKLDRGITLGLGHLRATKKVILIASGASKAQVVRLALKESVSMNCPASIMQQLPQGMVMLDTEAAVLL